MMFDVDTVAGIDAAEKAQAELYDKYDNVEVVPLGTHRVAINYW